MAVGDQTSGASLAELWNGKDWTAQPEASAPNSGPTNVLLGVPNGNHLYRG